MRTTLTIDDKLANALRKKAYESGESFNAVVNRALQAGMQTKRP
jgi:predicted HicB family RNase H-like nuclease